jgi:hypothetical protein
VSFDAFQAVCLGVLGIAYAIGFARAASRARFVVECLVTALAAWAGEETCIRLYRFYGYADGWWLPIGHVPLLIVLIWPQVVVSARAVTSELWPRAQGARRAALVGGAVLVDASLIEGIAVAAGLWAWAEPGYLAVPPIGLLGWAFFAGAMAWALERTMPRGAGAGPTVGSAAMLLVGGPAAVLATHALLLATWWGALRWTLRGEVGSPAPALVAALAGILALAVRRAGRRLHPATVLARVAASAVFFALLAGLRGHPTFPALAGHTALVALVYLAASVPDLRAWRQWTPAA